MEGRRHALLGAAALALAGATGLGAWRARQAPPETRPIPSAPGFRRLVSGGPVSSAALLTVGLESEGHAPGAEPFAPVALCAALFQAEGRGMPVAGFTDYRCPTCPAFVGRLSGLGGPPLAITWHEWPILGASSRFSARVALAAGLQGKHGEMHAHLMRRRLRPSEAGVRSAASALDLDADRLLSDMDSDAVASRLAESARLARQFGFVGTPALVIGGTVLDGLPAVGLLRRLAQAGGGPCSA